jgi:excisionase family DNA binding protein
MERPFSLEDCVFTIPEAASHLRLSRSFIYKLVAERKLKPVKVGSRTIIPGREIQRFIKAAGVLVPRPDDPIGAECTDAQRCPNRGGRR